MDEWIARVEQETGVVVPAARLCRRCKTRPATQPPRGRYANLCDGCKHKATQEWKAQVVVAEAPRARVEPAPKEVVLCADGCGRPAATGSFCCESCVELASRAADLPVTPTPAQLARLTEQMQAARARAQKAIDQYKAAMGALARAQEALRVQHQVERREGWKPKAMRRA